MVRGREGVRRACRVGASLQASAKYSGAAFGNNYGCRTPRMRGVQYAVVSRFNHGRLWNTGCPLSRADDERMRLRILAAPFARALHDRCPSFKHRGRREDRVTAAPGALAPEKLRGGRVTTGTDGNHSGLPCAVVYGLLRALPGEPACCHRHQRIILRELGACMGAPGPHDFAVRLTCRSSHGPSASTAFRSTFVTTRTSLCKEAGCGGENISF
jgi:hypothetical protein